MADANDDQSYAALARQLVEDGEGFARARVGFYRELAIYRATQLRAPALLFVFAFILSTAAFIAIIVGIVLALEPLLGGLLAGLAAGGGAIAMAVLLAMIGRSKLAAMGDDPLAGEDDALIAPAEVSTS